MNKKIWIGILVLIIILVGIYFFASTKPSEQISTQTPESSAQFDPKNSTFYVEGQSVTLVNGVSEVSIPNSSSKVITKYFGDDATGDLNNDGLPDIAFLITQDGGGSGTFYYVVAALNKPSGYQTTNAVFIGDRIAPQSTVIDSGQIKVNYADRKPEEPMTATPSVGKTLTFTVLPDGSLEDLSQLD